MIIDLRTLEICQRVWTGNTDVLLEYNASTRRLTVMDEVSKEIRTHHTSIDCVNLLPLNSSDAERWDLILCRHPERWEIITRLVEKLIEAGYPKNLLHRNYYV